MIDQENSPAPDDAGTQAADAANKPAAPAADSEPATDKWKVKYERVDGLLREAQAERKNFEAQIAELKRTQEEGIAAAKAEAEAKDAEIAALRRQADRRDFEDNVISGVAPDQLHLARELLTGKSFQDLDISESDAAEKATAKLKQIAPNLFASAPIKRDNATPAAPDLVGMGWREINASPEHRAYVKDRPHLTRQLMTGVIKTMEPPEKGAVRSKR